jgi:predicted oxidoreductase
MAEEYKTLPTIEIGPDSINVSRLAMGMMGLTGTWNPDEVGKDNIDRAVDAFSASVEEGITFFDHADIYGNGTCEEVFKHCLQEVKPDRNKLFIASKCGIRFADDEGPYRYDLSFQHITQSVQQSLERMDLTYIDLYQVHRRDPLTHPAATAEALNQMVEQGLIRYIGVSNYTPSQIQALQKYLRHPVITVQPEFSLMHLGPMNNGLLDYCEETNTTVLAYSPISKGLLSGKETTDKLLFQRYRHLRPVINEIADSKDASAVQVALAWLMHNPVGVIPIYGSNNPEHIKDAVKACSLSLDRSEWYRLWTAAHGEDLP